MVRPTINSEKHIVQIPFNANAIGETNVIGIVNARDNRTNPTHVRIGSTVKAVYIELWILGDGQQTGTQITILEKTVGDAVIIDTTEMITLNEYRNKKNIFNITQGLTGDENTNPVPVMRGWYKIPKGKQRMGQGDGITIATTSQVTGYSFCGNVIFKEYY